MALPERLAGLRLPVVAAPMFQVSGPELVLACAHAGVLGTLPALNQRTTAGLREWLARIAAEAHNAPYGVNLIAHSSNPRLAADLDVIVEHRVPVVITSLGASDRVVAAVHSYGGLVFHDVTTLAHALRAIAAGVDGLILIAAGAGGHASQVQTSAIRRADPFYARETQQYENPLPSREYVLQILAERGVPETVAELSGHPLVYYVESSLQVDELDRALQELPDSPASVRSTSVFAHVEATAAGAGIGLLPDFLGDTDARLARVLDGAYAHPLAYWAVARDEGPRNPAVAATLEAMTGYIRSVQEIDV